MMARSMDWRIAYTLFTAAMVVIGYATYLIVRGMGFESISQPKRRKGGGLGLILRKMKLQ